MVSTWPPDGYIKILGSLFWTFILASQFTKNAITVFELKDHQTAKSFVWSMSKYLDSLSWSTKNHAALWKHLLQAYHSSLPSEWALQKELFPL